MFERELGRGGMATVYLARDLKHDRPVAIKVLRPELAVSLGAERFLREIRVTAHLTHPHILPLLDSGQAGDSFYYVTPYVEGESLRARLARERQLPVDEALLLAAEVAGALDYAHRHQIVHRDIKPGNILLEEGQAVVADFGIARAIQAAGDDTLTGANLVLGTPAYMSPEQAAGSQDVDGRSDIYSLACVVYEMLAGRPPFTGPTPQTVRARHQQERTPSLQAARATVPAAVQEAIETALSKAPADRFATASQFAAALTGAARPAHPRRRLQPRRRNATLLASAAALGLAGVLWQLVLAPSHRLDPQRLVVYPLVVSGGGEPDTNLAESVTDALREALSSTEYIRAVDGWHLLDERQRSHLRALSPDGADALARRKHAGAWAGGQILAEDSVRLFLQFRDLVADSALTRQLVFPRGAAAWSIGVRAARELLPVLIPPGRGVDLTSFGNLSPAATASFLQGERAYRRGRFKEALGHYRNAVGADSTFALAALKGAQSASWDLRYDEANQLIGVAHANAARLPPRYAHLTRGFKAYLSFRADSAVEHFKQALALDPEWAEAWTGLGEVYTHLLPGDSPLDSLAEAAFTEAHRLDPTLAPVVHHLLEIALRKGDSRAAARLMQQFRKGQPDSLELVSTELMLRCVQKGPGAVDWRGATLASPRFVTEVARSLTVGGLRQAECARAAWLAVLAHDSTSQGRTSRVNFRWGGLFGLQSVLLAEGRYQEVVGLLERDTVFDPALRGQLYILDAVAGADAGIAAHAELAATRLREAYGRAPSDMGSLALWYLAVWEAHRGRAAEAGAIGEMLAARAAKSGDREESLLAQSVAARAALARGDSAEALNLLQALTPTAPRPALTWSPWESLGGERMLLAELRFARGELGEAIRIATALDAPAPIPYVIHLPTSLTLRLRAAGALGDEWQVQRVRARLVALGRNELAADGQ